MEPNKRSQHPQILCCKKPWKRTSSFALMNVTLLIVRSWATTDMHGNSQKYWTPTQQNSTKTQPCGSVWIPLEKASVIVSKPLSQRPSKLNSTFQIYPVDLNVRQIPLVLKVRFDLLIEGVLLGCWQPFNVMDKRFSILYEFLIQFGPCGIREPQEEPSGDTG